MILCIRRIRINPGVRKSILISGHKKNFAAEETGGLSIDESGLQADLLNEAPPELNSSCSISSSPTNVTLHLDHREWVGRGFLEWKTL